MEGQFLLLGDKHHCRKSHKGPVNPISQEDMTGHDHYDTFAFQVDG
jgi:hypothetical protein